MTIVRSVSIVDPLLTDDARKSPVWRSWLQHVALVTFCLQHEFVWPRDKQVCNTLVHAYLDAFDAVPHYAGFQIPKHHIIKHLAKYLELFGPFRQSWCMPYEAFLQLLKKMFNMSNYKNAPSFVIRTFAARRAVELASGDSRNERLTSPSSERLDGIQLTQAQQHSILLRSALSQPDHASVHAAQFLRSFRRGTQTFATGDWILVASGSTHAVMRVAEIAQLYTPASVLLRLWCDQVQHVVQSNQTGDGRIVVPKSAAARQMLIRMEHVSISLLQCKSLGSTCLEFRYSF